MSQTMTNKNGPNLTLYQKSGKILLEINSPKWRKTPANFKEEKNMTTVEEREARERVLEEENAALKKDNVALKEENRKLRTEIGDYKRLVNSVQRAVNW